MRDFNTNTFVNVFKISNVSMSTQQLIFEVLNLLFGTLSLPPLIVLLVANYLSCSARGTGLMEPCVRGTWCNEVDSSFSRGNTFLVVSLLMAFAFRPRP